MRPALEQTMLAVATALSLRSTCPRRRVGCVLVDRRNRIIATGHNGVPPGEPHCTAVPCPGASLAPGEGLDLCEASHAEMNALIFCPDITQVHRIFCTASPCLACVKGLLMTPAEALYFLEEYPHELARQRWTRTGRRWIRVIA